MKKKKQSEKMRVYWDSSPEVKEQYKQRMLGKNWTIEQKEKQVLLLKSKKNCGGIRKGAGRGTKHIYKDVILDSTWELTFVKRCDSMSIIWERKYVGFSYIDIHGNQRKYYPDFYLPEFEVWVEIKGYWTSEIKHKIESATKKNNLNLIVLDKLDDIRNFTQPSTRGLGHRSFTPTFLEREITGSNPVGCT
jgi:predicted nuclease of restriction endonuclease-like RecB superfamily